MGRGVNLTILVVDDDPIVRALLVPVLTRQGYSVLEADGGQQGIELFFTFAPQIDLILTDITMPVVDGVRMVETIRNSHFGARVLFMSGRADTLPEWASNTCGFLLKPFQIPQLMTAIHRSLNAGTQSPQA